MIRYVEQALKEVGIDPEQPLTDENRDLIAILINQILTGVAFLKLLAEGHSKPEAVAMLWDTLLGLMHLMAKDIKGEKGE